MVRRRSGDADGEDSYHPLPGKTRATVDLALLTAQRGNKVMIFDLGSPPPSTVSMRQDYTPIIGLADDKNNAQ